MHRALSIVIACLFTAGQALAAPFEGSCSRSALSKHGGVYTSQVQGQASQIGSFTGTSVISFHPGHHAVGPLTIIGSQGDTITLQTEVDFDNHFIAGYGTYTVSGGTGQFAGATGSGSFQVVHQTDGSTIISWSGTLSH